jgi:hypothetical protein
MLSAEEIKIIKMLQNNPELLARVQDENAFTQAVAETRVDRNHRFILGAIDARERTNWTEDERNAQDLFIEEVCDVLDSLVSLVGDRFKVKSNEKGEAWHALSYLTESGATLSFKMDAKFGHAPNKDWGLGTPTTDSAEGQKATRKR